MRLSAAAFLRIAASFALFSSRRVARTAGAWGGQTLPCFDATQRSGFYAAAASTLGPSFAKTALSAHEASPEEQNESKQQQQQRRQQQHNEQQGRQHSTERYVHGFVGALAKLERRGCVYRHFDSADCFRELAADGANAVPIVDFVASGDCSACRGRIFAAPFGNRSLGSGSWAAACLPETCLAWQARIFFMSSLRRNLWNHGALLAVGEPVFLEDCPPLSLPPGKPDLDGVTAIASQIAPAFRKRVAVCIYGQGKRLDVASLQSLRSNVILPFSADVFALVDAGDAACKKSEETRAAVSRARCLLKAYLAPRRLIVEVPPRDLDVLLEAASNVSMEEWRRFEARLAAKPAGTCHVLRKLRRLLAMVEAEEVSQAARYDLIVGVRADLFWLAPPPLHLMEGDHVWIPDGQDFGGLNDRWAAVGRGVARLWFGRWDSLRSGRLVRSVLNLPEDMLFDPKLKGESLGFAVHAYGYQFYAGAELLLARAFDLAGGRGRRTIRRLPSTAALRCPGWTLGAAPTPRCTAHGFRSLSEVGDAHNVVARLEQGWEWTSRAPWKLEFVPNYFDMVWSLNYGRGVGLFECCAKPARLDGRFVSVAGYGKCFPTEFFTFHRVCHAGLLSISLHPGPRLHGQGMPTCWRVGMETDPDDLTVLCLKPPRRTTTHT